MNYSSTEDLSGSSVSKEVEISEYIQSTSSAEISSTSKISKSDEGTTIKSNSCLQRHKAMRHRQYSQLKGGLSGSHEFLFVATNIEESTLLETDDGNLNADFRERSTPKRRRGKGSVKKNIPAVEVSASEFGLEETFRMGESSSSNYHLKSPAAGPSGVTRKRKDQTRSPIYHKRSLSPAQFPTTSHVLLSSPQTDAAEIPQHQLPSPLSQFQTLTTLPYQLK